MSLFEARIAALYRRSTFYRRKPEAELASVTVLELSITPDTLGGSAVASLQQLRFA